MSQLPEPVFLHAAFYNVGMQSAQLDQTTQRHMEHMHRLEYDLGQIVRTLPELHVLHLCEFGTHGDHVPQHVRDRVTHVLGNNWSVAWDNNYVVLWKPSRLRMVDGPALEEVSTRVRAHQDVEKPHTYQRYTCCVEAGHGRSCPVKVIHVHHRSSKMHRWSNKAAERGLQWLQGLTADSTAWLIGGDLNTPQFPEATCVFDARATPSDLALASSSLNPNSLVCRVGRHFAGAASISDAHSVVAVELWLPNVAPLEAPPPPKVPPRPQRSAPKHGHVTGASPAAPSAPRPMPAVKSAPKPPGASKSLPTMGPTAMPPTAVPLAKSMPKPPPALGASAVSRPAGLAAAMSSEVPPSVRQPHEPPSASGAAMALAKSVPPALPATDASAVPRVFGLGDRMHVDTPPPSPPSSRVDTPRPTSSMMSDPSAQTEFDLPQSQQAPSDHQLLQVPMSTPEVSPSVPRPDEFPSASSAAMAPTKSVSQPVQVTDASAVSRLSGLGDRMHVDAPPPSPESSRVDTPTPTSSMMLDPLPQTEFDLLQSQQAPSHRPLPQVPMSTMEVSPIVPEPLQDIVQPVPGAIPQTQFALPQLQQAPTDRQVPQAAMAQQQNPQPAAAAQSTDGTEPVDHKNPEVVQHFQHYFGVAMTFTQVMELFDKGAEPTTFVPFGKMMAFDQNLYSYEDFANFYGEVAGREAWNFAYRVHQDLLLALHHVQNITNVLRLYADVHPQVLETRDSVFRLLFDPTRVPQHGEPPVIALMRMLLRPLWVRRQKLEKDYGPTARFPQRLEDHVLGEVWNKWQKAWYKCGEAIGCCENKKRRNAWFAMLKQRCGGAVWAKLLVQYGPGEMANLLGAVLDARENRETAQAPIMPAARATMRQHGAG